ncbi:MAG TPA: diacylglycerol kinase family lipid kinase [Candidatus Pelethomonas intestinigallinarum]|nr:diacylglycerol kinase family lipid kinase [Candidatus Pelethomonas intestinigallinarum]
MANTLLFIVNPRAGRTRSTAPLFDAVAHFCASGYLVDLRLTQAREDATRLARELGGKFDAVVCCGGDGTLNETVTGLMDLPSPPPLGYIPAGSTNDFAASLHLPDQPLEAARVITASGGRPLDVGSFNGRPFIYVASFGAFTRASYSAPQNVKNDLGHLAYILEGVKDLSTLRPYRASVATEEECFDGEFLFGAVTNATSVGGLVKLKEDQVCLDDGLFELLLIPNPKSIADLQGLARSLLLQDFTGGGVIFRHVHTLTVQTPEDLPWALDGEFDPGGAQVEIHNLHRRLTFLI